MIALLRVQRGLAFSSALLAMAWATSAFAADDVWRLPKGQDMFFRLANLTQNSYIRFQKNGAYRRFVRGHLHVKESDHGTWTQGKDGVITIRSKERVKPLRCGVLTVDPGDWEMLHSYWSLGDDIAKTLKKDKRTIYSVEEVKKLWRYPAPRAPEALLSPIKVARETKTVSRKELMDLSRKWPQYLNRDIREVRHITPLVHKEIRVLVWHETPSFLALKQKLDRSKEPLRWSHFERYSDSLEERLRWSRKALRDEGEGNPSSVQFYRAISAEQFKEDVPTTQPFRFFPGVKIIPSDRETDPRSGGTPGTE